MRWIGKHKVFQDLMIGSVLLTPPDPTYEYELTLPNDDGSAGQVLTTDGSGVLTWTSKTGGSGVTMTNGVDNRVMTATAAQAITGEANFTYDGSVLTLASSNISQTYTADGGTDFAYLLSASTNQQDNSTLVGFAGSINKGSNNINAGQTVNVKGFYQTVDDAASANVGDCNLYGLHQIMSHTGTGGNTASYGVNTSIAGGDLGNNIGLYQNIADGGLDLKFISSDTTTDDYFSIATKAAGETDIKTVDGGGSEAHLNFDIDGDIDLDANGDIFFDSSLSQFYFMTGANEHVYIGANSIHVKGSAAKCGDLNLYEDSDNGTNKIRFKPPDAIASDKTITLPDTTGTVALTSDIPALSVPVTVAQGGTGLTTVGTNYMLTGNGTGALSAESTCTYNTSTYKFRAGLAGAKWEFGGIYGSGFPSVLSSAIGANAVIDGYSLFGTSVASMIKFNSGGSFDQAANYIEAAHATGTDKSGSDLILVGGSSTGSDIGGSFKFFGGASGGGSGTTQRVPSQKFEIDGDGNTTMSGDLTVTGGDITLDGTGRIQGIDTVSAATDAASKGYVDGLIPTVPDEVVSTGTHILKQTKVTLSQANCNSLFAIPRTLVAAQGANKIIIPVEVTCLVDRNSADTSAGDLIVGWNGTTTYTYALKYARRWMYGILTDMTFVLGTYAGKGAASLTGGENVSLTIVTSTGMTTNSLTSMTVYTSYYVIDNS